MRIGDEVYIHGYVDEIRKDTVIIRNKGGYFGTVAEEVMPATQSNDSNALKALERKKGEWLEENRRPKSMMFYCSECHRTAYDPQNHHGGQKRCRYAFCPNCGADMRGENNG